VIAQLSMNGIAGFNDSSVPDRSVSFVGTTIKPPNIIGACHRRKNPRLSFHPSC
jgi:hypothetical protein